MQKTTKLTWQLTELVAWQRNPTSPIDQGAVSFINGMFFEAPWGCHPLTGMGIAEHSAHTAEEHHYSITHQIGDPPPHLDTTEDKVNLSKRNPYRKHQQRLPVGKLA